jgi:hypothetical protein
MKHVLQEIGVEPDQIDARAPSRVCANVLVSLASTLQLKDTQNSRYERGRGRERRGGGERGEGEGEGEERGKGRGGGKGERERDSGSNYFLCDFII